jgi:hypothetical protein
MLDTPGNIEWNTSTSSVVENVAELQFGPDFEDIHSTF